LFGDGFDDVLGVAAGDGEMDVRVLAEECAEDAREDVLCDGGGGSETELAGDLVVECGEGTLGFGHGFGGALGVDEEDAAGFGEGDLGAMTFAAGAVEEAGACLFFEGADLLAYGGLAEVEGLGGLAEAELFGNGAKDFEAEVLHGLSGREPLAPTTAYFAAWAGPIESIEAAIQ
jgi:hypothetical protein